MLKRFVRDAAVFGLCLFGLAKQAGAGPLVAAIGAGLSAA
jgi:hypothetical protein